MFTRSVVVKRASDVRDPMVTVAAPRLLAADNVTSVPAVACVNEVFAKTAPVNVVSASTV